MDIVMDDANVCDGLWTMDLYVMYLWMVEVYVMGYGCVCDGIWMCM